MNLANISSAKKMKAVESPFKLFKLSSRYMLFKYPNNISIRQSIDVQMDSYITALLDPIPVFRK